VSQHVHPSLARIGSLFFCMVSLKKTMNSKGWCALKTFAGSLPICVYFRRVQAPDEL